MRRFRDFPVKYKLILIALAASGAGLLMAGVLALGYDILAYRSTLAGDVATMADIVGGNATAALSFNDPHTAEEVLGALRFKRHIARACIYSRDGAVFARYARGSAQPPCPPAQTDGSRFRGDYLEQFRRIELKGEVIGTVYIESDLEEMYARLRAYGISLFVIVGISVLGAFLLAVRLQGLISRPILDLVRTADLVSRERNYTVRAEGGSGDEMGQLIGSFNEMLEVVERHQEQLQERNAQLEAARATAEMLAFHDPLTKLPNRHLFQDRLSATLRRTERHPDYLFALLYLDLDHFKVINDSLGHQAGDELLIETAHRLRTSLRRNDAVGRSGAEDDLVARLGGDEFIILLDDMRDVSDAIRVAERIHHNLAYPLSLRGRNICVTGSIGIATSASKYRTAEEMLRDADTAMYRAKAAGRGGSVVFDEAMHVCAVERLHLESELRHALDNEELVLFYQPVMALRDERLVGLEALVRWRHPRRGLVSPGEFIPLAEETGMILRMGAWVLREACRQMHRWQRFNGETPRWVSVNISAKQFGQLDFVEQVAAILHETGLEGSNLRLELTESVAMEDAERTRVMIDRFQDLGVSLCIDDFGTGFSSLNHLHRFSVGTLKIDRSFVLNMSEDRKNRQIIKTILGLAEGLRMKVVAEGTETAEQVAMLRDMGCDWAQGYYYFSPLESSQAEAVLELHCRNQGGGKQQQLNAAAQASGHNS